MQSATTLDNSAIITKTLQYSKNVGFDEFCKDAKTILDMSFVAESYAQELFDKMRRDFGYFFCNIDGDCKKRFVRVALAHYGYYTED